MAKKDFSKKLKIKSAAESLKIRLKSAASNEKREYRDPKKGTVTKMKEGKVIKKEVPSMLEGAQKRMDDPKFDKILKEFQKNKKKYGK